MKNKQLNRFGKIQKSVSFFLIFSLLFSLTFRIPFYTYFNSKVSAKDKDFYNLVSIIVEEEIYDDIKGNVKRYALDIQGVMENTRVAIFPTPSTATYFDIASLNESLYFEGYKGVKDNIDFESRLIGTVLIGKIPIPVVFDGAKSSKTIYPYIDFEEKKYVYNNSSEKYEKNKNLQDDFKAEIWHGIINPNSSENNNSDLINDYFDKNHDFYQGTGLFQSGSGIINGNLDEKIIIYNRTEDNTSTGITGTGDNLYGYDPFVFYYDQEMEQKSLNTQKYQGFNTYMNNDEDITYHKYSKDLSEKTEESSFGDEQQAIEDLVKEVESDTGKNFEGDFSEDYGIDTESAPEIQTRHITEKSSNKFLETFGGSFMGDTKKFIYNAGRYNKKGTKINVDFVPYFVSIEDQMATQTIKAVGNAMEDKIDDDIKNGISQYIALPTKIELSSFPSGSGTEFSEGLPEDFGGSCSSTFTNFLHGKEGELIKNASECTIYKGNTNGILVEANRGYNLGNLKKDLNVTSTGYLDAENIGKTTGYWGGCSPLNLDKNKATNGELVLEECVLEDAIQPLFDIQGSKKITDSSKNPNPKFCFNNNYILSKYRKEVKTTTTTEETTTTTISCDSTEGGFDLSTSEQSGTGWDGASVVSHLDFQRQFEDVYKMETLEPEKGLIYPAGGGCEGLCYYEDEGDGNGDENSDGGEDDEDYGGAEPDDESDTDEDRGGNGGDGDADNNDDEGAYIDFNKNKKIVKLVPCDQIKKKENKSFFDSIFYKTYAEPLVDSSGSGTTETEECAGFVGQGVTGASGGNEPGCCVYRSTYLDGEKIQKYESGGATACTDVKISGVLGTYMGNAWYQTMSETPLYPLFWFEGIGGGTSLTATCRVVGSAEDGTAIYEPEEIEWEIPAFTGNNFIVTGDDGIKARRDNVNSTLIFLPSKYRVENECSTEDYYYKRITSWVEHESPTNQEAGAEIQSIIAPNLPIDNDRYIDFIGATKTYHTIPYVKPFREDNVSERDFDKDTITSNLSNEINTTREALYYSIELTSEILSELGGLNLQIYHLLKTGEVPGEALDIKEAFTSKESGGTMSGQTYKEDGNSKELHYWDVFTQNIFWRNMRTITEKYRYIFENYLSDQFGNDYKFVLPKNKKIYEIAYIGAPGDYDSMHIKIEPDAFLEEDIENKKEYDGIVSENIVLDTYLSSSSNTSGGGVFDNGSENGTSISGWMSTVSSWTSDSLVPKINYSNRISSNNNTGNTSSTNLLKYKKGKLLATSNNIYLASSDGETLDFSSDSYKYYHNNKGTLAIDVTGLDLGLTNYVKFSLDKLEKIGTGTINETIYDLSNSNLNKKADYKKAQEFINFNDLETIIQNNKAEAFFSTRMDNVDVYFKVNWQTKDARGNIKNVLESESLKIEIRGDKLSIKSYKLTNSGSLKTQLAKDSIKVSHQINLFLIDNNKQSIKDLSGSIDEYSNASEKMIISIDEYSKTSTGFSITYPLEVNIYNNNGEHVFEETNITEDSLSLFKGLIAIQKSGIFDIIITDSNGYWTKKTLTLIPEKVSNIDIKMTPAIVETGKSMTEHTVSLLDQYGNLTTGYLYDISIDINGDGVLFYNDKNGEETNSILIRTMQGAKKIKLVSTNDAEMNTLIFSVTDENGEEVITTTSQIETKNNIKIEANNVLGGPGEVYVGGDKYLFKLRTEDSAGNLLTNFNSKLYIRVNSLYGSIENSSVDIIDGEGEFNFISNNLAAEEVKIEFWAEGLNNIDYENITILPDVPMKIELALSDDNVEAKQGNYVIIDAILRDRYGNLAFNDDTTYLRFSVRENEYGEPVIETTPGSNPPLSKRVKNGKASFKVYTTDYPGTGYFQVNTISIAQKLSNNCFDLEGQYPFSGNKLKSISGILENKKLTTLGENFFTEVSDYEFLSKFSKKEDLLKDSNYLALSSSIRNKLSNLWNQTNKKTICGVSKNAGNLETFYYWGKNSIDKKRYNSLYSVLLGAPYGDVTKEDNLSSAILFDKENRGLSVTSILNDPYRYEDVVAIDEKGNISNLMESTNTVTQDITSEINVDSRDRLYIDLFNDSLSTYIGKVYYNFPSNGVDLTVCNKSNINDCINNDKTGIIMESLNNDYSLVKENSKLVFKNKYSRESIIIDEKGKIDRKSGLYLDIDKDNKRDYLALLVKSGENIVGRIVLNFINSDINITRDKNLLNTKLNTLKNTIIIYLQTKTYGTRKIGNKLIIFFNDPLALKGELNSFHSDNLDGIENYLKKPGIGWGGLNKTILSFAAGKSVGESTKDYISFSLINLGDPVVRLKKIEETFLNDGINTKSFDPSIGKILNKKELADYEIFDYDNDNKDDILLISEDGSIEVLENKNIHSDFINKRSLIYSVDIGPNRHIKTGDFSGDGYEDIFFINEEGKPVLFNNNKKDFSRIELNNIFSLSGSVVLTDVYDMDNDKIDDIITLDDSGEINIFYGEEPSDPSKINFTKSNVVSDYGVKLDSSATNNGWVIYHDKVNQQKEDIIDTYRYLNIPYVVSGQGKDISLINETNVDIENDIKKEANQTTFIKSEYDTNLLLEKKYVDRNGGFLQAGDIVDFQIKLIANSNLSDVAVMYNLPNNFKTNTGLTVIGNTKAVKIGGGAGVYSNLIDNFSLSSGEELILEQELETLPMIYGDMQIGLYESGSLGDDLYGDIIMKKDFKNKGEDAIIYRSISNRSYSGGIISPEKDKDNVVLPKALEKNSIDTDANGMPDFLDKIMSGVIDEEGNTLSLTEINTTELNNYADSALSDLNADEDCDCIPDYDDKVIGFDESSETFSPGYECTIPFGNTCLSLTVDGETGRYVGDTNGGRPTFRFNKTGENYCGGGACEVIADCKEATLTYSIEDAGTRESQGEFLWKPESDSDGNLVVLLPSKYSEGFNLSISDTLSTDHFLEAIEGLDATSKSALQDVSDALVDIGYDACAYYEEPLGYIDKINVNGKIYDVLIYFEGSGWNPFPIDTGNTAAKCGNSKSDCSYAKGNGCNTTADACSSPMSLPSSCEDIEWVDGVNMCDREIASSLKVSMTEDSITMDQTITSQLAGEAKDGAVGNPWIIFPHNCKRYGNTWERMRPYQKTKSIPIGMKRIVPSCWEPIEGETYGIMVSGLARFGSSNKKIKTDIKWIERGEGKSSGNKSMGTGFHHYNNKAWDGKGLAIVLCTESPSMSSCDIVQNGVTTPLIKHGQKDKSREVFTLYNTLGENFPGSLTIKCTESDGGGTTSYSIDNGSEYQNGDCSTVSTNGTKSVGQGEFMNKSNGLDNLNDKIDKISETIDNLLEGFSCGFGGCISTPLNWAPLAPGGDPVLLGETIGDGFKINEGLPIFSALTRVQIGSYCGPFVWPPIPLKQGGSCTDGVGAGGRLGIDNKSSYVRIFLTPTLTGAMGLAVCLGGPAKDVGDDPGDGVHPIMTGGNCIVMAYPFFGCDGEDDGEPNSMGYPKVDVSGDFSTINGNANKDTDKTDKSYNSSSKGPLVKIGNSSSTSMNTSVSVDTQAIMNGDFSADAIKIELENIMGFPDFLMDWVDRQIKEIVNKITDLPTIYIILPDFSGIFDSGWDSFDIDLTSITDKFKSDNEEARTKSNSEIDSLKQEKNDLECDGSDWIKCQSINLDIQKNRAQTNFGVTETVSGIKAVYEFLGSIPLVDVKQEIVNVNIPFIDETSANRIIKARTATIGDREETKSSITDGSIIKTNIGELINSVEKNIEIIEEYKDIPSKVSKLLTIKETRLNQILENIDNAFYILLDRIPENGKRFKAWVELYILIKAILKSWQLFIDIFNDFDAECHVCKNERQDTFGGIVKLVSMMIPDIPIIEFPKWPDIIIDLHHIKAGLTIYLPEFNFNIRPIVLPLLPDLDLSAGVNLPTIPELPKLDLPDLPDIPVLPEIDLPDLPSPPTIPKLYGAVEIVLKIVKLILKIKCLKDNLPFFPEKKAGDQIAYLTERGGYLPLDFIDLSLPKFSYSFVDAIKITTYVNLEFETDFIMEMVEQVTRPLNAFTSDIVNMFDYSVNDIDANVNIDTSTSMITPKEKFISSLQGVTKVISNKIKDGIIYMDKNKNKTLSNKEFITYVNKQLAFNEINSDKNIEKLREIWDYVGNLTYSKEEKLIIKLENNAKGKFNTIKNIINKEKEKTIETKNQIENLIKQNQSIKQTNFNYNKSDIKKYNEELRKYNYDFVKSAVRLNSVDFDNNEEVSYIKKEGNNIINTIHSGINNLENKINTQENLLAIDFKTYETTDFSKFPPALDSEQKIKDSNLEGLTGSYFYNYKGIYISEKDHNYLLFDYLDEFKGDEPNTAIDIDNDKDNDLVYFMNKNLYLKENLKEDPIRTYLTLPALVLDSDDNKFYNGEAFYEAINGFNEINVGNSVINVNFAKPLNQDVNNFRLEFYSIIDKVVNLGNNTYIPKNIKKFIVDSFANIESTTLLESKDNYNIRKNLAYINYVGNNVSNIKFTTNKIKNIKNNLEENNLVVLTSGKKLYSGDNSFYIEYFTGSTSKIKGKDINTFTGSIEKIVDKYSNIEFDENINIIGLTGDAYIEDISNTFDGIKEELDNEGLVTIKKWDNLYSPDGDVSITYYTSDQNNTRTLSILKESTIQLNEDINIIGLTGEVYKETDGKTRLVGQEIVNYIGKPILPGAKIEELGEDNIFNESSHIDITYYDSSVIEIDFNDIYNYRLYSFPNSIDTYSIRTEVDNDFYYARIKAFKNNIDGTFSKQILLSPQKESDKIEPELDFTDKISLLLNKTKEVDFTSYIYENSGVFNIEEIYVDFDLDVDSDGDGDTKNDNDNNTSNITPIINIDSGDSNNAIKEKNKIAIEFGPYNNIFKKQIRVFIKDNNNNIGYKDIDFEVYSSNLEINSIENNIIKGSVIGTLSGTLNKESIGFYRTRSTITKRLENDKEADLVYSNNDGKFEFNVGNTASGLFLTNNGIDIAKINEYTGNIKLYNESNTSIKISSSNADDNSLIYPKISVLYNGNNIFNQYLNLSKILDISLVDDFDSITSDGIYIKLEDMNNYNYYEIPSGVSYNPGTFVIYNSSDSSTKSLFSIFTDGRINTINSNFEIRYGYYEDYITYNLYDLVNNRYVAKVLMKIDSNYITQKN